MDTRTRGSADFSKVVGKIKPGQHGANSAPNLGSRDCNDFEEPYRAMGFTYARTHDWPLWNPGERIIDTHFVFPLMKLDPGDPSNYYFKATDEIIANCIAAGSEVFYRLGTSIEHTSFEKSLHFNSVVPGDFGKYAEVLAGIIRHYTRGWADGFRHDISHWEIWNEPDLVPQMWTGDEEQFSEFFAVVLKRLKDEFPELKIGGPGFCWLDWPELGKIGRLLDVCEKHGVKPDFISWHQYTDDDAFLVRQPIDVRKFLDDRGGYEGTELVLDEWHYLIGWQGVQSAASPALRRRVLRGPTGINAIDGAAFNLAVLSEWQKGPLDIGCYYGYGMYSKCFGWYTDDNELNKSFHSMRIFGDIAGTCGDRVETVSKKPSVHLLGAYAKDRSSATLLVTDYRGSDETICLDVKGLPGDCHADVRVLDDKHDLAPAEFFRRGNRMTLVKNDRNSAAFVVKFGLG